jgi:hypothetical protein
MLELVHIQDYRESEESLRGILFHLIDAFLSRSVGDLVRYVVLETNEEPEVKRLRQEVRDHVQEARAFLQRLREEVARPWGQDNPPTDLGRWGWDG